MEGSKIKKIKEALNNLIAKDSDIEDTLIEVFNLIKNDKLSDSEKVNQLKLIISKCHYLEEMEATNGLNTQS